MQLSPAQLWSKELPPLGEIGPPQTRRPEGWLDGVRKIAVLRANALGDFIFVLPALDALRMAYPEAEIVLLGRDWHLSFLSGRPGPVDRVVPVPPAPGIWGDNGEARDRAALEAFFVSIADERFDLAIQLHGGGRHSNLFVTRFAARVTAGLRTPDAAPLDRWVPYIYFQPEPLRYLEVVSLVGAPPVTLEPRLAVTEADLVESLGVVPDDGRPLVVVHPGATDERRRWPPDRFARVADGLIDRGARVIVTGTDEEEPVVKEVLASSRLPVESVCGEVSLRGLTGLLSRAAVVVSNDTGPLHLSRAVGTPSVGIYWCGNFINGGPTTRALSRAAISWRTTCPECGVNCLHGTCDHESSFTADVEVDQVLAPALSLLELSDPA